MFTDYGNSTFFAGAQRIDSNFALHELRAGLNYQFGNGALPANALPMVTKAPAAPDTDNVNFHGQTTFVWQGYPAIRSPFEGANSLPHGGQRPATFTNNRVVLWRGGIRRFGKLTPPLLGCLVAWRVQIFILDHAHRERKVGLHGLFEQVSKSLAC